MFRHSPILSASDGTRPHNDRHRMSDVRSAFLRYHLMKLARFTKCHGGESLPLIPTRSAAGLKPAQQRFYITPSAGTPRNAPCNIVI